MKNFESEIIEIKDLTPTVKYLRLSVPEDFTFKSGQFVTLMFQKEGKKIARPYSISSPPSWKGFIEVIIKIVENGVGSEFIKTLNKGDKINITGPMGGFEIKDKENDLVFIATGNGINPLRSMIQDLLENGFKNKIIVFKGVRYISEILYAREFEELKERYPNLEVHDIVSRPEDSDYKGEKGHVQDLIAKNIQKDFKGHFYICGLRAMIDDVVKLLTEIGIPKENIHYEGFN